MSVSPLGRARDLLVPLTGRGWVVLVTAVLSYTVGVLAGYPVFRALAGVGLGGLVVAVGLTVRSPRVDVRRAVYPDRVEKGNPALATLRVGNTGQRWQPGFAANDVAGTSRVHVAVRRLAPGAEATYRYELPTNRRGRLAVGPLVLERCDPLGLARRGVTVGGGTTLWVRPKLHPARTVIAGRPRHHHESRTIDESLRGSADLRDVRPYVVGDEVRHVHWKATARLGQLMVRDYVDPNQPHLTVLLDTRPGVLSPERFEEAVEVVASVAFGAAMAGQHCRLLTPDGLDLPPAAGPAAARLLLDTLTEIDQTAGDMADRALLPAMSATGGGFVVVTGPELAGPELAPLGSRYRSVTVVSIGPSADSSKVSSERVRRIVATSAADAVRQWNLVG